MRKKQFELIEDFLNGNLSKTKLFADLTIVCQESIKQGKQAMLATLDKIDEAIKSRGDDSGTFDLKNEIFANYQITKSSLEKELIRTKQLYSKAASITLENGLLRCFFTQRKSDSFSSQAESESIDIAGNRLYLRKVMVRVPDRFLESDPREDLLFAVWILKILRQNNYLISGIISEEVATGYPEVYYL
jgi:hypothetical protein